MSEHEDALAWQLKAVGIGGWEREYRFAEGRASRFDFAWPELKAAVEVDGWGHHHLNRFLSDHDKLNAATLDGWRVLRVFPKEIESGEAIAMIERLVGRGDRRSEPLGVAPTAAVRP